MDKPAPRSQSVQNARPRGSGSPAGGETPPTWHRLHLGLTGLLALVATVLLGLLAAGKLRFAEAATAPPTEERPRKKADKPRQATKGGRYQIEVKDDLQMVVSQAGKLDFFGERILEAQAYLFKGGYLECWLEAETDGKPGRGATVPQEWARLLDNEPKLAAGESGAIVKEGHVVVAAMRPAMLVSDALVPFYPHLGGLLVAGPAGPLHQLTTIHVPATHAQVYRIFVTTGPPTGEAGSSFSLWTGQVVTVRLPFIPPPLSNEPITQGGGTDLAPESEATLMDRQRGGTHIRLKARFLSDDTVRKAAKKP